MRRLVHNSIAAGIAWALIAEVARHDVRPASLRVIEMHPGGGQADLLCLLRQEAVGSGIYNTAFTTLGDFNLTSGILKSQDEVDELFFLHRWLFDPDHELLYHLVLQGMDLPLGGAPTDSCRRLFGIELMAALTGRALTSVRGLKASMGYHDSSGIAGSSVHPALRQFDKLFNSNEVAIRKGEDSAAAECWLLKELFSDRLLGAVRMDGVISGASAPGEAHDFFAIYKETLNIVDVMPLVWRVLAL